MTKHPLTPRWAVFNGHINDADKRARALMAAVAPEWLTRLEKVESETGGIMGIFNRNAELATTFYAALVTGYVNEERAAPEPVKEKEPEPELHVYEFTCFLVADFAITAENEEEARRMLDECADGGIGSFDWDEDEDYYKITGVELDLHDVRLDSVDGEPV